MMRILSVVALLLLSSLGFSQDWQTLKEEDGIVVESRERQDSDYHEVRATAWMAITAKQALGLLNDTKACSRWMHNCLAPKLLAEPNPRERYTYMRNNLPWPFKDRALVAKSLVSLYEDGSVEIALSKVEDADMSEALRAAQPETKKFPRLDRMQGTWRFVPEQREGVAGYRVSYQVHTDLGGSPAPGLANPVIADTPFKTLGNMRRELSNGAYADFVIPE